MKQSTSLNSVCEGCALACIGVCVCVPRLPLLPMLGSLASAIQLYSGGMETGLRSPGSTNHQSDSLLWGRNWGWGVLQDAATERQSGTQLVGQTGGSEGVCR